MKIKIFLLAMICSLSLVGCSTQDQPDKKEPENTQNQEQQKEEPQNEEVEKEESKKEEEQTNEEDQKEATAKVIFNLYTIDVNDYSKVIPFENKTFTIQTDKSIENNLQELCNTLKKEYFKDDNIGIKVVSIDNDKIATINLTNEEAWMKHFQGSAGGIITQGTIVETLLQKQYQGDWIKGLKIQVDGKDGQEYDHVTFTDTFMRDSK
ncbi:hypothetical protein [Romboutsia sp.]|uniref:hypothetical protein n=1 Tax=Romboutsia sp. TaxID=1965302 RepID=UPI003F370788